MMRRTRALLHVLALVALVGGYFCSLLVAQAPVPIVPAPAPSLMEQWLQPQVVIGGVLVVIYVVEIRADLRAVIREHAELKALVHKEYMTKELAEARYERRRGRES